MDNSSEFLSISEVATCLRMPSPIVRSLIRKGLLPAVELEGEWLVREGILMKLRSTISWQSLAGGLAMVELDSLSDLVMRKAAIRFGLTVHSATEDRALSLIEEGETSVLLLRFQSEKAEPISERTYAEIRKVAPDLPVAVMADDPKDSRVGAFLLREGPVTLIDGPIRYHHAERLLKQFGFRREPLK